MNTQNDFKSLKQTIDEYSSNILDIKSKIEILKKYANIIIYNSDYQESLCNLNFIEIVLQDILLNFENKSYMRHFILLLHNILVGNNHSQIAHFNILFLNKSNFNNFQKICSEVLNENKIRKFLLSIIYNTIICNDENLKSLNESHLEYIVKVISSHDFNLKINGDKDLNEINDWYHILIKNILKKVIIYTNSYELESNHICWYLLNPIDDRNRILFLELFRDFVDYSKDLKCLYICEKNLSIFINRFISNVKEIYLFIKEMTENKKLFVVYEIYKMTNDDKISYLFREFICFVDILSAFLIHEEDSQFRRIIQNELNSIGAEYFNANEEESNFYIINVFHFLLSTTDNFYESTFKRNKLLKEHESFNVPNLDESNVMYGFQTNILKFMSNFAFKNENLKNKFLKEPKIFYYFLNHMKLDKCNPFKKEWTVLFIKSLTEGSYKIQNLIETLKPQEMDPLLRDYIINKGNIKLGEKEVYMDLLNKKNENDL